RIEAPQLLALLCWLLTPDPLPKPLIILLHQCALLFWLVDAVAESFEHHHLHRDTFVFKGLSKLVAVRDRHTFVELAMLNQRRSPSIVHIADRRRLSIDLGIFPRRGLQILTGEGMNVGVDVVCHPIGYARTHRHGTKSIAVGSNERRDVATLTPSHGSHSVAIDHALCDQKVDSGYHIPVVSDPEVAHVERPELLAIARRAPVVRSQYQRAFCNKHL